MYIHAEQDNHAIRYIYLEFKVKLSKGTLQPTVHAKKYESVRPRCESA